MDVLLWILTAIVGLVLAGLSSGLETGVYSLNPVRLHVLEHTGLKAARRLARHMAAPAALIASLLISHNAGVKIATHAAAVLLSRHDLTDWQIVVFDAIIMMPLLFIFAETVPKNLFAVYADRLMVLFVGPLHVLVMFCRYTGVGPLLTAASDGFTWLLGLRRPQSRFQPRHQIEVLVREGVGYGILDDEQGAIAERMMTIAGRTIAEHMQPWDQAITVSVEDRAQTLWDLANRSSRTRFPVVDAHGAVVGILNINDVLVHAVETCPPVRELLREASTLEASTPLRRGLAELRTGPMPIAVVLERGRPVGLITLKDLLEPVTGELAAW